MPLQLPNLDDRTFDDLMQEALSLIPSYSPEWTNYNPSDPGITLIELFAYLTEILLYRQNQVTMANRQAFLNLIVGLETDGTKKFPTPLDEVTLNTNIREAIQRLREVNRAVTCEDFEAIALRASPHVARAHCVPRRNLRSENPLAPEDRSGHVSIVIVPKIADIYRLNRLISNAWIDYTNEASTVSGNAFSLNQTQDDLLYIGLKIPFRGMQFRLQIPGTGYSLRLEYWNNMEWKTLATTDGTNQWTGDGEITFNPPEDWIQTTVNGVSNYWLRIATTDRPSQVADALQITAQTRVLEDVANFLEPRRLLTTKVHVVEPRYFPIRVQITLMLKADAEEDKVLERAIQRLQEFFHPIKGGNDRQGWPFGRDIYVSEIYEILDQVSGVDYVQQTVVGELPNRRELEVVVPVNPLDADRRRLNNQGQLVSLTIDASELIDARIQSTDITVRLPPRTTALLEGGTR